MTKYLILLLSTLAFSQQTQFVDFKTVLGKISINAIEKTVSGEVKYDFEVLKSVDTISIDAQNMTFTDVKINGKNINFLNTTKKLQLIAAFKKGKNKLTFRYQCQPKQTFYFFGAEITNNLEIWTQGQGKYTSNWFPSFDDVNEKVTFNLDITFDKKYEVISNGKCIKSSSEANLKTWQYRMKNPMSSYLLMLAIGNFEKKTEKSKSKIPLEMYFQKEDTSKFETTYRYSKTIFDFLESEIGVKYLWEIYKQIPVHDFLYAGMENTSATLFSQDFVVDSVAFNDRNYINVNAHELSHQWFGNLITAKSGKHHWLQEGFATYYALLAEQSVFGEDYFNWKMYEMAERLQQNSKTDTIPILNEKASSLSFYQKGAWALHVLRENVGRENFQKAVKSYLEKYKFKNVSTEDFLAEINKFSNFDTEKFKKKWLETSGFDVQEALSTLQKNNFIKNYFEIAAMKDLPLSAKRNRFEIVLNSGAFYPLKEELIFQLQDIPFAEKVDLLRLAMKTNCVEVRQAIVQNLTEIPMDFKAEYETFLNDKSYITQEIALNFLWTKYPEEQVKLLTKTKDWVGFNDKNLRILWLTLALKTNAFQQYKKVTFYKELLDYASPEFESSTRQNALTNLIYLDKNDENYLPFLVSGLTHFKWQFVKFSKDNIRKLLKNKNHRAYFEKLSTTISVNEKTQLDKLLKE
ncbi:MAG: M1 family metallopeptidase [Flavobacterium sp.]|nr:M1 family metallopeptidase [Flavobacterium sp.]